jgi:hypothetical protein
MSKKNIEELIEMIAFRDELTRLERYYLEFKPQVSRIALNRKQYCDAYLLAEKAVLGFHRDRDSIYHLRFELYRGAS